MGFCADAENAGIQKLPKIGTSVSAFPRLFTDTPICEHIQFFYFLVFLF